MEADNAPSIQALFALGRTVATPGALALLGQLEVAPLTLLVRHQTGEWAEMCQEDQAMNRLAVAQGLRVFSSFELCSGPVSHKVWIITEWDRSVTTILMPEDS